MIDRSITLVDKIDELINLVSNFDEFCELAIVDQEYKIVFIKPCSILTKDEIIEIFNNSREKYKKTNNNFQIQHKDSNTILSLYFTTKNSEISLVGVAKNNITTKEESIFKLIGFNVKDIFETIDIFINLTDRQRELESLLGFYKSITTPINKELFLAYILDKIIIETNSEVGSIMIVSKELQPISIFSLGLSQEITIRLFEYKKTNNTDIPSIIEEHKIQEILQENSKGIINIIYYPIKFENELVGIVFLANKRIGINYIPFSEKDIEKLKSILAPVGIIIKNYIMFRDLFLLNQLNQKILSNITTTIVLTDNKFSIKHINKPANENIIKEIIHRAREKGLQLLTDVGVELQLGNYFYEVKTQPIFDESGEIIEMVWTIEDITYRKELINRYVLSEKMNIISEIVSGIAHEIRNPITSISGFIELLKTKKDDKEFIEKFIEITSKDIERITNLLNSFIKFSKPVKYEMTEVSINNVISETIDILLYQINQKGIKVINKLDKEIIVKGNHSLLLQVFTNIILNSIQAINHSKGEIEIGYLDYSDQGKDYIVIFIKDNGIGIPDELQEKVFDPFFTTKPNGTGLGLSISQKIIMEHGGFIRIKSKEQKETTIMVFLPQYPKQ